jgi:hypothetical protein
METYLTNGGVYKYRGRWRGKLCRMTVEYTWDSQKDRKKKRVVDRKDLTTALFDSDGDPITCDMREGKNANKRKAEAAFEIWRNNLIDEQRAREEAPGADTSVSDFIDRYITTREKDRTIERSTISDYRSSAKYLRQYLDGVTLATSTRIG